jgi:hypothetical protein
VLTATSGELPFKSEAVQQAIAEGRPLFGEVRRGGANDHHRRGGTFIPLCGTRSTRQYRLNLATSGVMGAGSADQRQSPDEALRAGRVVWLLHQAAARGPARSRCRRKPHANGNRAARERQRRQQATG